jgi:inosose dehydratase
VGQRELDVVTAIDVGTASVNWGFDPLYTWVATPSFEQMLDEMAAAGYSGTEISYNFPSDPAELRHALDIRRLRAAATFYALDLRDPTKHEAAMRSIVPIADRLQALGSNTIILSDAPSPARLAVAGRVAADGSDGLSDAQWRAMGEGLNRIGEQLATRGMQGVFHPHVGTYVESRAEIDRLCSVSDSALILLCPDTGHLAYAGVRPEDIFRDYADRIGYVHLKDVDGELLERVRSEKIGFVRAVEMGLFVELGSGVVDIDRIVTALDQAEYHGWLTVEQDAPRNPLDSATANRRYLREEFGL